MCVQQIGININLYVLKPEALREQDWDSALDWDKLDKFALYWHTEMYKPLRQAAALKRGLTREDAWGSPTSILPWFAM